jgi:YD repeat-containing protein
LIAEDSLSYNIEVLHAIPNYKVFQIGEYEYTYSRSYTIGGSVNVSKEVNRQYTPDGKVIRTSKEYDYSSPYHKKPTETRVILSQGGNITERYYYPTEYGSYFQTLINKNILNPVDVRSYRNGTLIAGVQIQYDANGLPLTKYKSESAGTDIAFNKSTPFTFTPYLWNTYSTANLLASQKTRADVATIILWGYRNQYPIAEIRNATLAETNTALNTVFGVTSSDALSAQLIPNEAKLKDGSLQRALPNALITTYTYKPLAGMLTSTDPAGITTYYEYDDFGRLKETYIKDGNGTKQAVRKYDYHYQNQ